VNAVVSMSGVRGEAPAAKCCGSFGGSSCELSCNPAIVLCKTVSNQLIDLALLLCGEGRKCTFATRFQTCGGECPRCPCGSDDIMEMGPMTGSVVTSCRLTIR